MKADPGEGRIGGATGPALRPECAAVRDRLYARAEGERLSPAEIARLDAHVSKCDSCAGESRRASEFTSRISGLLRDLRPAGDMRRRVLDRIGPSGGRRRTAAGICALAAAAASGLVVLVLARERPVARIAESKGVVRVLRASRGAWRAIPSARAMGSGERIELAGGGGALLATREGTIRLEGPALAQIERGPGGGLVLHVLAESRISADVKARRSLVIRAGTVRVSAEGARFSLSCDRAGTCLLEVASGTATARDASGEREVRPGGAVRLGQGGGAGRP